MSAGASVAVRTRARDLATLGFCAAALLVVRSITEDVHVPGHSALPAMLAFVYASRRVALPGAAAAVALPSIAAAQLGFVGGAGGAASLFSLAALVELARFVKPGFARSVAACAAVGALAGLARFATQAVPLALGIPDTGAPALASVIGFAMFGAAGATLVPLAAGRLAGGPR